MLLSSPADIRRVAILAGALPHDLIQPTTGLLPLSREDIESALRASNTKVRSRGWQEFLVGAMIVKQLLPDKKNFSQVKGTGVDLYRLYKDNKWQPCWASEYEKELQQLYQETITQGQQNVETLQADQQRLEQSLETLQADQQRLNINDKKLQERIQRAQEHNHRVTENSQQLIDDAKERLAQQTQKKKNYDTTKKALRANQEALSSLWQNIRSSVLPTVFNATIALLVLQPTETKLTSKLLTPTEKLLQHAVKPLWGVRKAEADPGWTAYRTALKANPHASPDYAFTGHCLAPLRDTRIQKLFERYGTYSSTTPNPKDTPKPSLQDPNHPDLQYLRHKLLTCGSTVRVQHFFRADGTPRPTIAEVAFAIAHRWTWKDTTDAVLASVSSMFGWTKRASTHRKTSGASPSTRKRQRKTKDSSRRKRSSKRSRSSRK
jgi:hypothetical protein